MTSPAISSKPTTNNKLPGRLAWALAAVAIFFSILAFALGASYMISGQGGSRFLTHQAFTPLLATTYALLGALIISRRPRNPLGWIFLTVGLLYSFNTLAYGYQMVGTALWGTTAFPGYDFAEWINRWIWIPAVFLPTTFVFLLFPEGRLPSRRWRPIAWATGLGIAVCTTGIALHPGPVEGWGIGLNPYRLEGTNGLFDLIVNGATVLIIIGIFGSILALIIRFRRSTGTAREQMKWLVYACAVIVIGVIISSILSFLFPESPLAFDLGITIWNLTILGIAVAASIAILRYRLYEIDLIINRTLVYGTLTTIVVLLYILVVGAMSALFQTQGNWLIALVATGIVAVLFQPLRQRLQRGVNHLIYGRRDEPFEVLAHLGQRLEASLSPEMVIPTLVETVSQTLKLPYVAIAIKKGGSFETVESYGRPVPDPLSYPLTYQGELIGHLLVAPRTPGESFNEADERLLLNVARQAGTAVRAVQLTADLQRSRQRLVTTREEERRRLRRDLHDGLGPTLAALHVQSGVLRRMIRRDPELAEEMVGEFRDEIRLAIDDIRRVVYELRPPALDELGLVAAIQAQAERVSRSAAEEKADWQDSAGPHLQIQVKAPATLPPLPAAVEVAAYRIVQEALTNVVHHAQANHCLVRLELNGALQLEVIDDGVGLGPRRDGGLGLLSMRERAAELGGNFSISSPPDGGTQIHATLPYTEVEDK